MGPTLTRIVVTSTARSGSETRNTAESCTLMRRERMSALIIITGARTKRRMPIMSVICMELTSLVRRVMSEAVENFSILEKAKV